MAEVLYQNLEAIQSSDILDRLGLEPGKYMLLSAHREENIDTEKNFRSLYTLVIHVPGNGWTSQDLNWMHV